MRRQKRSLTTRAFNRGYQTGLSGRSQDICPHEQSETRANWLAGWRSGRSDYIEGYSGVACLQRVHV